MGNQTYTKMLKCFIILFQRLQTRNFWLYGKWVKSISHPMLWRLRTIKLKDYEAVRFANNLYSITESQTQKVEISVNLLLGAMYEISFENWGLDSVPVVFCMRVYLSCMKFWQWKKCFVVLLSLPKSHIRFRDPKIWLKFMFT